MTDYRDMEQQLREEIVHVGQLLHQKGFVAATDGNISARWGEEWLLVTPSGVSKGFMRPEQLIVTDLEGRPLATGHTEGQDRSPSAELRLHLEAYRQRPDIRAVVRARSSRVPIPRWLRPAPWLASLWSRASSPRW